MAKPAPPPLTDADHGEINNHLRNLARIKGEIDQALKAGVDCSQEDQHCQFLKERLETYKRVYFPDRP